MFHSLSFNNSLNDITHHGSFEQFHEYLDSKGFLYCVFVMVALGLDHHVLPLYTSTQSDYTVHGFPP